MLYMHGTFRRIACLHGGAGPQVGEVTSLGGYLGIFLGIFIYLPHNYIT